jgi:hypothetical protein
MKWIPRIAWIVVCIAGFFWGACCCPAAEVTKQVPACPGCTCGCQEGYECTCSQMPTRPVSQSSTVWRVDKDDALEKRWITVCSGNSCRRAQQARDACGNVWTASGKTWVLTSCTTCSVGSCGVSGCASGSCGARGCAACGSGSAGGRHGLFRGRR